MISCFCPRVSPDLSSGKRQISASVECRQPSLGTVDGLLDTPRNDRLACMRERTVSENPTTETFVSNHLNLGIDHLAWSSLRVEGQGTVIYYHCNTSSNQRL